MIEIEKLRYEADRDSYGNTYGVIPPSKNQIVEKINEIIECINKQEEGKNGQD